MTRDPEISTNPGGNVCAVLLAAGGGTRFHAATSHKLLALMRGRPVYEWAIDAVLAAGFDALIVVTGAVDLPPADSSATDASTTATTSAPTVVHAIHNPRWADGQATSLQCGIQVATELGADAIVVGLADQPFVTTDAWRSVAASPAEIAVATYDGQRANPVLLRRSIWSLLPSEGDHGARSLIALRPELINEVACSGSFADIDTMEDLQQWNSSTNSP